MVHRWAQRTALRRIRSGPHKMAQVHLAGDSSDQIEHEALLLEEDIPERRRLSLESNQMSRLVQGQT